LYAAVLLLAGFEHHDLSCELKTPQHCIACVSTAVSADPPSLVSAPCSLLADAGAAVLADVRAGSVLLGVALTGPSPPPLDDWFPVQCARERRAAWPPAAALSSGSLIRRSRDARCVRISVRRGGRRCRGQACVRAGPERSSGYRSAAARARCA